MCLDKAKNNVSVKIRKNRKRQPNLTHAACVRKLMSHLFTWGWRDCPALEVRRIGHNHPANLFEEEQEVVGFFSTGTFKKFMEANGLMLHNT